MDTNNVDQVDSIRAVALFAASLFFGLSCLAERSIPASVPTIIKGAEQFEDYLRKSHSGAEGRL